MNTDWIDKQDFKVLKVDYYDRRGDLLKTLEASDSDLYEGKFWRASTVRMVNHQTGKSTELIWSDWKFKTGLKDDDFTRTRLQQVL